MRQWRTAVLIGSGLVAMSACSVSVQSGQGAIPDAAPTVGTDSAVDVRENVDQIPDTTGAATTSIVSAVPASTDATTTTTTVPEPEIYDPQCVVLIERFDSLAAIAAKIDDDTVNVVSLRAENDLPDADLTTGEYLDVCVDNGLDDISGAQRTGPNDEIVAFAVKQNVEIQQRKLNQIFTGLGTPDLLVDGISGPVTRQRLCAARLAFGLPVSTLNMAAGSEEEDTLLSADSLPVPFTSSVLSERWILIDRTCQIMFVGEGTDELTFVFPTSTGSAGYETRDQDRSQAFRFDPARENGGWHDSLDFPSAADNPLNGNMYKPLYFDLGQAIHGANNVPTSPQSKGCARLRVHHQDQLVTWMGLADVGSPLWNANQIHITINVQGDYVAR